MADEFKNLVELFQKSCDKHAAREVFGTKTSGSWSWMTYRDFRKLVDDFRGALANLGVKAGDRLGIVANNRVEWAVAAYATYGLRAAFVPMYEQQHADEWEFILDDCGAKVAIGSSHSVYDELKKLKGKVNSLEHVIGLDAPLSDEHSYKALLERGAKNPKAAEEPGSEEIAGFIYTS